MSDTGYISVDLEQSEYNANQINNASTFLTANALNPMDSNTTIKANENVHNAFAEAQSLIALLGSAMDKEVGNIRSIGKTFDEYDAMLADLANQAQE